jgi:hypothetical protein
LVPQFIDVLYRTLKLKLESLRLSNVILGGITKNMGIPDLSDYEMCLLENAIPLLAEDIKKGEFVGGRPMEDALCDPCDPNPKAARCPPDHCELQSMFGGGDKN